MILEPPADKACREHCKTYNCGIYAEGRRLKYCGMIVARNAFRIPSVNPIKRP